MARRALRRWITLATAVTTAVVGCTAGCSSGSGGGNPPPPIAIVITGTPTPPLLFESTPAPFTIQAVDTTGAPRPFASPLSISAKGPVRPGTVMASNGSITAGLAFDLGGDSPLTVTGTGLTPATIQVYVAPAVPARVVGSSLYGSVIGPGTNWDKAGAWSPSAVVTGGQIRLYYASSSAGMGGNIGLATSPDGVHFTRYGTTPLVGPSVTPATACHATRADHPFVYNDGTQWVMLYEGDNTTREHLCRATSPDGLTWTPVAGGLIDGSILTVSPAPPAFDNVAVHGMAVVHDLDGSWLGVYSGEGTDPAYNYTVSGLGLARSTNGGLAWFKVPGLSLYASVEEAILEVSDDTEWDNYARGGPALERVGPVYRLWCTGLGTPASPNWKWRIGRYSTLNPLKFGPHIENYSGSPTLDATAVIGLGASGGFDDGGSLFPSVVIGPDGVKRVYYTGLHAADGIYRIGVAAFQ